jgi:2-(1,2-epoxy-1,2-dihydrophenyl)acetyl-CoA isomerase
MSDQIIYSVSDRVATLTLNRPEVRNAISPEVIAEIIQLVRAADRDSNVKCILIRGAGDNFCAGGDVKSFQPALEAPPAERFEVFERRLMVGNRLPKVLLDCSKPIVIATRGAVAGAGMALCLAADFVIASDTSYFLAAHVHIGLCLDSGLSGLLVAAMGIKAAKRLALLGERIDAHEAVEVGLITRVVGDGQLEEEVQKLMARLAAGPALAMAGTRQLLHAAAYPEFSTRLAEESLAVARCAASADFRNGINAMLSRDKVKFD